MRTSAGILFSLAVIFVHSALIFGQSAEPGFSINISGPKTVKPGESFQIKVVLTNTSDHRIDFKAHDPEELNYSTEVFKSNGRHADYTTQGYFWATGNCKLQRAETNGLPTCLRENGPPILVSLGPGGKYITWIVVTEQFLLSQPGDYSIRVSRSTAGDPRKQILMMSNTITVTVAP